MAEINFAELSEDKIWDHEFTSELQAIRFSQNYGLIMADPICHSMRHHQQRMNLVLDSNPLVESYRFQCSKKHCRKKIPLRRDSFCSIFSHANLKINQIHVYFVQRFISSLRFLSRVET